MKPNQLWLDVSTKELRIWIDSKLNLAQAKGSSTQRVGFFREIPLFVLPPASAHPMGWTSFTWSSMQGKFAVEDDFWMALDAARFTFLQERPETFQTPLALEIPLASDVYFYGGTFTPWHEGHRACLNLAPPNAPLIVCPDRNPHKPLRTHDDVVSFYLDLKESIVGNNPRPVLVYPGFLLGQESNPTVSWVLRVKRKRPDLRIHLMMGYDSFKNLSTWTEAHDLIRLISGVAVASRLEQDAQHATDSAWALTHNPQLQINFLGRHPYENVSSTELLGKK